MKRCTKCGENKPLAEFSVLRESKQRPGEFLHRPRCKSCEVDSAREYRARHPERHRETARRSYGKNRARALAASKKSHFKRKYGLTPEEYTVLLLAQHGVCAICHQPETAVRGSTLLQLAVDHDHVTGQVRGLLCHRCNQALGHADDSTERLKAMIYYLEGGG